MKGLKNAQEVEFEKFENKIKTLEDHILKGNKENSIL